MTFWENQPWVLIIWSSIFSTFWGPAIISCLSSCSFSLSIPGHWMVFWRLWFISLPVYGVGRILFTCFSIQFVACSWKHNFKKAVINPTLPFKWLPCWCSLSSSRLQKCSHRFKYPIWISHVTFLFCFVFFFPHVYFVLLFNPKITCMFKDCGHEFMYEPRYYNGVIVGLCSVFLLFCPWLLSRSLYRVSLSTISLWLVKAEGRPHVALDRAR